MFEMIPFRRNNNLSKRGDAFEQIFGGFFDEDLLGSVNFFGSSMKVDLKENENNYIIEADLPGVKKDAIDISYENNYLTIAAKRQDSVEENSNGYLRRERKYGEFKRSFYIDDIDESKVDASFKEGVLKITLPKKEEAKKNKKKFEIH